MNVALTGFMGAGKSSTAKRLARLLDLPLVDTDREIQRMHGSIAEIFSRLGEEGFRRIESELLERVTSGVPAVIAVGGGAVLAPTNRTLLRETGFIVYLAVSAQSAWRRVARKRHRPVLGESPDLSTVQALMTQRLPAYEDCDFQLSVDGRTPMAVAQIVARWYQRRLAAAATR